MDTALPVAEPPPRASVAAWPRARPSPTLSAWRDPIERRLDALVPAGSDDRAAVVAAMRDALLAPGKRLRPLLLLAAATELGADAHDALDAACALEMVHAASLVLDDLPCMDDARLRRGRPTVHVAHGQDVAILASVGLLARAFAVVASQPCDAAARASGAAALAAAVGTDGLVGGQLIDLRGAAQRHTALDAQRCNARKTSSLFVAAVDLAAAIAAAPRARSQRIRAFAWHLGCAFQLRDDVHDVTGDSAALGKDTGRDGARRTLVGLAGVGFARRRMERHLGAARRALGAQGEFARGDPLLQLLEAAFGADRAARAAG